MRASLEHPEVQVVAVNDPFIDLEYMVIVLKAISCSFLLVEIHVDLMILNKFIF